MTVRYSPRAIRDLNILDYIAARSTPGAQNVKRAIRRTIEFVGEHPQIGRRMADTEIRMLRVNRYPYLVYWSVEAGEARIVHIRHAARRPWEPTT